MSMTDDAQLCEMLTRYVAGDCTAEEVRELSARLERDTAACDLLAEILMQGAAVREYAQAHPQAVASAGRAPQRWQAWLWPLADAAVVLAAVIWMQNLRAETSVMRAAEVSGSVRWTGQAGSVVDSMAKDAALVCARCQCEGGGAPTHPHQHAARTPPRCLEAEGNRLPAATRQGASSRSIVAALGASTRARSAPSSTPRSVS